MGLDQIIDGAIADYGLGVHDGNRDIYLGFLRRQLGRERKKIPGFDVKYEPTQYGFRDKSYNIMIDKLMLFSYLIGQTTIDSGYLGYVPKKGSVRIVKRKNVTTRAIGWYSPGDINAIGEEVKDFEIKPLEERKDDLYLLRKKEMGFNTSASLSDKLRYQAINNKTDLILIQLFKRINIHLKGGYNENFFDDIGKDKAVEEYFGCVIDSKIIKSTRSPNPNTMDSDFMYG